MKTKLKLIAGILLLYSTVIKAQPGSLDLTFGTNGSVMNRIIDYIKPQGAVLTSSAIQSDGKIVLAGELRSDSILNNILFVQGDFLLTRFNTDGTFDNTFGTNGKVSTKFVGGNVKINSLSSNSIAIQSDGKILVVGSFDLYGVSNASDFALARYNTDGSLDNTFGSNGKIITDLGGEDLAYCVAIQLDGKILIGGRKGDSNGLGHFALARYNADGTLDNTFGINGTTFTDFGTTKEEAKAIVMQADGKIVLAGESTNNYINTAPLYYEYFALARYNTDGALDNTFGTNGKVLTNFGGGEATRSMAMQSDGKIVIAGKTGLSTNQGIEHFALLRYNTDGSLDNAFGTDGTVFTDFGTPTEEARSIAIQSDGKILVVGSSNANFTPYSYHLDFILARYNTNGRLDNSFGLNGTVKYLFGPRTNQYGQNSQNEPSIACSVLIPSPEKIIIVGGIPLTNGVHWDIVIAKFNSTFSSDIWPGDANDDLVANNFDFLNIGLAYDSTGAIRNGATNNWVGQTATDWTQSFSNTLNYKYADCNGDGIINIDDTTAISLNYGLVHQKKEGNNPYIASVPDLYLVANKDTAELITNVNFDIYLGSSTLPIDSIYGLAYSINYNPALVKQKPQINYDNSWFGNPASDLISFEKSFHSSGKLDEAVSKKNHFNSSGFGKIGSCSIITTDNLAGITSLHVNISNVTAITKSGAIVALNAIGDSVVVKNQLTSISEIDVNKLVSIYPNPSNGEFNIVVNNNTLQSITVTNMLGEVVYSNKTHETITRISLSDVSQGVYILSVKTNNGVSNKRITVNQH